MYPYARGIGGNGRFFLVNWILPVNGGRMYLPHGDVVTVVVAKEKQSKGTDKEGRAAVESGGIVGLVSW